MTDSESKKVFEDPWCVRAGYLKTPGCVPTTALEAARARVKALEIEIDDLRGAIDRGDFSDDALRIERNALQALCRAQGKIVEAAKKYRSECQPHPCPDPILRKNYADQLVKAVDELAALPLPLPVVTKENARSAKLKGIKP